MNKIMTIIVFVVLFTGCGAYAPHNQWKALKFTTPPDRSDQDRVAAEDGCKKKIDETSKEGMVLLMGAAMYYTQKAYEYQDCMAAKGYPCKDDIYPCAYEAGKK